MMLLMHLEMEQLILLQLDVGEPIPAAIAEVLWERCDCSEGMDGMMGGPSPTASAEVLWEPLVCSKIMDGVDLVVLLLFEMEAAIPSAPAEVFWECCGSSRGIVLLQSEMGGRFQLLL